MTSDRRQLEIEMEDFNAEKLNALMSLHPLLNRLRIFGVLHNSRKALGQSCLCSTSYARQIQNARHVASEMLKNKNKMR